MSNPMSNFRPGRSIITAIIIMMLIAALVGCSSVEGDGSCVHTQRSYGYETDVYGDTGLHLLPTITEIGSFASFISFEEMEAEYIDIEMCMANTNTPAPSINFTSFNHLGVNVEIAFYLYANQTAYIDTDHEDWLPARNCISDREWLRHEFGHHILWMNGEDPGHENQKFTECSARGPKSCNGEYCEKD